jgi:ABC-type Zn uptake system ZnuABC Zn-binding protein ZnuA
MQGSKIVLAIGGVDDWIDEASTSVGAKKIVLDKGTGIRNYSVPTIGEEENSGPKDPHYWMTMSGAKAIAKNIAFEFKRIDPDNAGHFNANLSEFEKEADAADKEIRNILMPYAGRSLITFHNAWSYFADAYGLRVSASFEQAPGKEPSPAHIRALSEIIKREGTKVIFSEPALSDASIKSLVSDLGLELYILYPEDGSSPSASYIDTMVENARIIARALSK